MQAIFKIYRASHEATKDALVLAGKVVKGTVRAGMKVSLALETQAIAELEIGEVEVVDRDGVCLLALVLVPAMEARDVVGFLERCQPVGQSVRITGSHQEYPAAGTSTAD